MYVIFGATGKTGGAAARALLAAKQPVRVVARQRERLQPLVDAGAEAHVADVEDARTVRSALAGATGAYLLTPPNLGAADFRGYQDAVTATLVSAVAGAGVKHVVYLSSLGADRPEGTGPIVGLHVFEKKLAAVSGLSTLALRAGFFYENFLMNIGMIKATGANGMASPPDVPWAMIAAEDIGRYAARRLLERDFTGFTVTNLIGPRLISPGEATRILGAAIGKPDLPYVQASYPAMEQALTGMGVPAGLAALYVEMYRGAAAGYLAPVPGTATVNTETTLEAFAPTFAAAFAAS